MKIIVHTFFSLLVYIEIEKIDYKLQHVQCYIIRTYIDIDIDIHNSKIYFDFSSDWQRRVYMQNVGKNCAFLLVHLHIIVFICCKGKTNSSWLFRLRWNKIFHEFWLRISSLWFKPLWRFYIYVFIIASIEYLWEIFDYGYFTLHF